MLFYVCYFTDLFYALVRQISMVFIDNEHSVFCIRARGRLKRQSLRRFSLQRHLSCNHGPTYIHIHRSMVVIFVLFFAKHIIVGRLFKNIHPSLQYSSRSFIHASFFCFVFLNEPNNTIIC